MRRTLITWLGGLLIACLAGAAKAETVRIGALEFEQTAPSTVQYIDGFNFTLVNESEPGSASAPLTPVDLALGPGNASTSGCEAADFAGFPAGNVALVQRGACAFLVKVQNAEAAGASAVLLFNSGTDGATQGLIRATLSVDYDGALPVFFLTYPLGAQLAGLVAPVVRVESRVFRGPSREAFLRYCLANRPKCSLSVKQVNEGWERHLNPDRPQSTASTYKTLALIAYAEAVAAGSLDPDAVVPRDEWAAFSVGLDGGALANVYTRLGQPANVTVDEMMRGMMRESDNAAPDWLLERLGQPAYASVVNGVIDGFHDVPVSINAQFASYYGVPEEIDIGVRVLGDYTGHADPGFQAELADRFFVDMQDPSYVASIRNLYCQPLPWEAADPSCVFGGRFVFAESQALLGRYFTRSTTRTYLRLAERLLAEDLLPPAVAGVFARHMEYRLEFPQVASLFSRYGAKGGSFGGQNVCNWVAYHEDASTGAQTIVTTMIQDAIHECGVEVRPWDFAEAFALDAAFRQRVRDEPRFNELLLRDGFEAVAPTLLSREDLPVEGRGEAAPVGAAAAGPLQLVREEQHESESE